MITEGLKLSWGSRSIDPPPQWKRMLDYHIIGTAKKNSKARGRLVLERKQLRIGLKGAYIGEGGGGGGGRLFE